MLQKLLVTYFGILKYVEVESENAFLYTKDCNN